MMLANRLRTFTPKLTPITLRTRHNVLTSNPARILDEFRQRFTTLYLAHLGSQESGHRYLPTMSFIISSTHGPHGPLYPEIWGSAKY